VKNVKLIITIPEELRIKLKLKATKEKKTMRELVTKQIEGLVK